MPTFVALLRGVNVGRANRVPMQALRELLTGLGYAGVRTLLNSGNAVFQAPAGPPSAHAKTIAGAIAAGLAVEVPVVVKSAEEFAAIVKENPFAGAATDHSRLFVAFTPDKQGLFALKRIEALVMPEEKFLVGEHAAYIHCPAGILKCKAGGALLGTRGTGATLRNWGTTLKLNALATGDA